MNPVLPHFSNEDPKARVGREAHSHLVITRRGHRQLSQAVARERESSQAECEAYRIRGSAGQGATSVAPARVPAEEPSDLEGEGRPDTWKVLGLPWVSPGVLCGLLGSPVLDRAGGERVNSCKVSGQRARLIGSVWKGFRHQAWSIRPKAEGRF